MKKAYLEIAKIINTHGVHGAVKLEPWCDEPLLIKKIKTLYFENGTPVGVLSVKALNGGYLAVGLSGVETVEQAIRLKNKILFAKREDIPTPKALISSAILSAFRSSTPNRADTMEFSRRSYKIPFRKSTP